MVCACLHVHIVLPEFMRLSLAYSARIGQGNDHGRNDEKEREREKEKKGERVSEMVERTTDILIFPFPFSLFSRSFILALSFFLSTVSIHVSMNMSVFNHVPESQKQVSFVRLEACSCISFGI